MNTNGERILCISPNPAIDRTLVVPNFTLNAVNRATESLVNADGKGVNVARACRVFGKQTLCMGFVGGDGGRFFVQLAAQEGLTAAWTWIKGETRTNFIVADGHSGLTTVVNERGPTIGASDWERLITDVQHEARGTRHVCISGSLPVGSPLEDFIRLITVLRDAGKTVWVDTSGAALDAARTVTGIGLKVNDDEANELIGSPIANFDQAAEAAEYLSKQISGLVVLTLGAQGALLANGDTVHRATPPHIQRVSAVGSGDAFLAGLVCGLENQLAWAEALRWGVAAGTTNALSIGSGRFLISDFKRILAEVT